MKKSEDRNKIVVDDKNTILLSLLFLRTCNYGKKTLIATWHKLTHWQKRLDILRLCCLSLAVDRQHHALVHGGTTVACFYNEIFIYFSASSIRPLILAFMEVSFIKIARLWCFVLWMCMNWHWLRRRRFDCKITKSLAFNVYARGSFELSLQ